MHLCLHQHDGAAAQQQNLKRDRHEQWQLAVMPSVLYVLFVRLRHITHLL